MKLNHLKATLALYPEALPRFILPDGGQIPAHFHITEVGHVTKKFVDCGGEVHGKTDTCLLQTYVADDTEHRLDAATFAKILDLGKRVLPDDDMEVEVEYDCCVVAQYPIASARVADGWIEFQLDEKHTDCLAKELCGIDRKGGGCETPKITPGVATCC